MTSMHDDYEALIERTAQRQREACARLIAAGKHVAYGFKPTPRGTDIRETFKRVREEMAAQTNPNVHLMPVKARRTR